MAPKHLSRREFLKATSTATVVALAGISPLAALASNKPVKSAVLQEGEEINLLIRTDIRGAYAGDKALEGWTAAFPDRKLILDEPATGDVIETKIQAAQAAGDVIWDGFAVIEGPWSIQNWVKRGLIVPLDDLIAASTIEGADQVVPNIIPTVLESSKFEGQQYTVPGNVGSVAMGWYTKPLADAGVEPPTTWDEVRAAAEKIKATSPDLTPYDVAASPLCDVIAMIWGATDKPLTDDGLIDWTGEAAISAVKWLQAMTADGLMPGVHTESFGNWLKGGTAMMSSFDVHGTLAQQAFGQDAAATGVNLRRDKDVPAAGTPFWLNGSVVLNQAKNAQGMADFFLWWFGPNNDDMGKQIATVAAKPAYEYTYDKFIKVDPAQAWQLEGIELVRNSVPFPSNLYWGIQNTIGATWIQKAVDPANGLSAEDAMAGLLEEIQAEIADMA